MTEPDRMASALNAVALIEAGNDTAKVSALLGTLEYREVFEVMGSLTSILHMLADQIATMTGATRNDVIGVIRDEVTDWFKGKDNNDD